MEFNLIELDNNLITVKKGDIDFPQYAEIEQQVTQLIEVLEQIEVDDSNVKEAKKLVAKVRKWEDKINRERIDAKKQILEPYTQLDGKIKTLTNLINHGDELVRNQIRELDEKAREQKQLDIQDMWSDAVCNHPHIDFLKFDEFMLPQYLNKTVSLNKIKELIIDYIDGVNDDLEIIESHPLRTQILKYYPTVSVARAIKMAKDDEVREQTALEYESKLNEARTKASKNKLVEVVDTLPDTEMIEIRIDKTRLMDVLKYCKDNHIKCITK